jgi:uncharacterized protein
MTPQERQLVDDLFDRLAKVENTTRDPDASAAIAQGLRHAPNAVYALVQTVLLQDEALKRANNRIQELEGEGAPEQNQSGFLDSMRETIFGQSQSRGSVPSVRPSETSRPTWNSGQAMQQTQNPGQYNQAPYGAGGNQQSFGDTAGHSGVEDRRPWGDQSGGDLAKEAGINDIGSSGRGDSGSRSGLLDSTSNDDNSRADPFDTASNDDHDDMDLDSDDFDGDSDSI